MEKIPSRDNTDHTASITASARLSDMTSMLAMPAPSPHAPMLSRPSWSDYRRESGPIELPPIRLAVPEFSRLSIPPINNHHTPGATQPSLHAASSSSALSPQYGFDHGPRVSKRRRLSIEETRDTERASQVPRLHSAHAAEPYRHPASSNPSPTKSMAWSPPTEIRQPPRMEERTENRPKLPGLPLSIPTEKPPAPWQSRESSYFEQRTPLQHEMRLSSSATEPSGPTASSYGFPSPVTGRYQPLSAGTTSPYDRSQPGPYREMSRLGEMPHLSVSADTKQRKRRGNLPKETTDKLRSWLHSHLQHPYPTEDEKQDLMRQTGLQMNQISNWFINARRRQLPYKPGRPDPDAAGHRPLASKPPSLLDGKHHSEGEGGALDDDVYDERCGTARMHRGSV